MSKVVEVKEAVKETLVGSEASEPAQISAQSKARFTQHAVKDPESGELFMGPAEFINAVAPANEDYVSPLAPAQSLPAAKAAEMKMANKLFQNSTGSSASSSAYCSQLPTAKARARSP